MQNYVLALAASAEPGILFTVILGVSVVFVGLVCIVGLVVLMNWLCAEKVKSAPEAPATSPIAAPAVPAAIPNRQEIIAAVVAAVAEEEGTDISAIRVLSFKKL